MMIVAALVSWFLVGLFITFAKRYGWGQPIRQEGPQSHLKKEGTPTAGGIGFVAPGADCWASAGNAREARKAAAVNVSEVVM